ncbi:hypothetical protein PoB_003283100 [Plakobranchus ocellatus]|uniref:Uncharacterized protein n=1 Tax=Plakobranchus ocellatus TaxID=259542 RepID=A0AAV4A523_9GAST|nr:hypothetical protein PoB_003283100 [Plakobranchus ocellatus]
MATGARTLNVNNNISASNRINICSSANSDIFTAVVVTSPSYPLATNQRLPPDAELLTCECILRASSGSTFEAEYFSLGKGAGLPSLVFCLAIPCQTESDH